MKDPTDVVRGLVTHLIAEEGKNSALEAALSKARFHLSNDSQALEELSDILSEKKHFEKAQKKYEPLLAAIEMFEIRDLLPEANSDFEH
jgi:hypothetical protein